MGWDYDACRAYGIVVKSWDNKELQKVLEENDLLDYSGEMAQKSGHIFVYIKSTYETIFSDHGSYRSSMPDINGDNFRSPTHPIYHNEVHDCDTPDITKEEISALKKVMKCCGYYIKPYWIEHADVDY